MVFKSRFSDVVIPLIPFHEDIFSHCIDYGDRKALICGENGRSYTYREVPALCRQVASGLVKLGVEKGTVVAVLSPNIPEYAFCILGVTTSGGVVTTINPAYTPAELIKQLNSSGAYIIITYKGLEDTVNQALTQAANNVKHKVLIGGTATGYIPFANLLYDDGAAYPSHVAYDVRNDTAIIPYSSGTTGLPKGVMLTHYNIEAILQQNSHQELIDPATNVFDPELHETTLCIIPMFHVYGMVAILLGGLRAGSTVVTLQRFVPQIFLNTIQTYKISELLIVPPLVLFMANDDTVKRYDMSTIKRANSGGAPLSADIVSKFMSRVGVRRLNQGYGMTETTLAATVSFPGEHVPGGSGVILPNTYIKIIDLQTGKEQGIGERGEIWIKGPQITKGYYKNPKATRETIDKECWLHTGDVGYFDEHEHLFVVDRIKELIKYKAFQVAPAEMEALLLTHPGISDAAVVGIPDSMAGELPRAYIITTSGHMLTEQQVHAFVKEKAAPFKQLRGGIVFVKSIPKSASGKILRREIVQEFLKSKL